MGYTIEHGPWDKRISVGELRTDEVMGMYDKARAAGNVDIKIRDASGEEVDPHQLALDLRSGMGR